MRITFSLAVLLMLPLFVSSNADASNLLEMLGIGYRSTCSETAGCSCEDACGCEADCGCEPSCGMNGACGRQFAGQTWSCCRECGPPICTCTGPSHHCEPGCGCGGGCEPGCGCESACGCDDSCQLGDCRQLGCFYGSCCGRLVGVVDRLSGCSGCDGELYWSEWHNDPPRCCDPCDCHGNWVGPTYGGYRAPYEHPYYVSNAASAPSQVARSPRPHTRGMTRRPTSGNNSTYQR